LNAVENTFLRSALDKFICNIPLFDIAIFSLFFAFNIASISLFWMIFL